MSGVTSQTGRLNRAHLDGWINGDCPSLSAYSAMAHLEPENQTRRRSLCSTRGSVKSGMATYQDTRFLPYKASRTQRMPIPRSFQNINVQISMADVGAAWQNGYAEFEKQWQKERASPRIELGIASITAQSCPKPQAV